ncbi:LysE/ArgO family amino acid transporter, partial [Bacillus sp. D-CC]
ITVSWIWFFGLTLVGTVMKKIDSTGGLMNIFNKCSALFIWGTAIYLFIGLI